MEVEHALSRNGSAADTMSGSAQRTGRVPAVPPFATPPPGAAPATQDLTPAVLLRIVRRRWKVVVLTGLAAAAAGFGVDRCVPAPPATYATHALIRVEPAEDLPGATPVRAEIRDLRTQAELVKTRFVLLAALAQGPAAELPAVRRDSAAVLQRLVADLKVQPVGPQILRVSLTGPDPDELPVLVNAVKDAYLREVVGTEQARRVRRKDFLEAAYRDCETRLGEKRREVAEAEAKAKAGGPGGPAERLTLDRFALLQNELFRTEMDLHRSKVGLALEGRGSPDGEVPPGVVDDLADQDPLARQQHAQLAQMDEKIAHWDRTTADPAAQETYRLLRRDRQALADAAEARKRLLVQRYTELGAAARQQRTAQAQDRAARLEEEEKLIRGLVVRGWEELKQRAQGGPDLTLKRYEAERLEVIAKQVTDELEGLRLETGTVARTASLQDAAEPDVKQTSRPWLRTGVAVIIPFLLVAGFVTNWEYRARRIYGAGDVRGSFGPRLLGAVPRVRAIGSESPAGDGWPSALTDAVDAVCAALLPEHDSGAPLVLMVTSAVPREGKSTLARHLAARLAQAGRKTLLLDADLYRPTVHLAYALPVGPGLSEVLCGAVAAAAAIRPTPTDDLFVLTAGAAGPATFREIARGGLGPVLADLRTAFDVVVVDTSPVLATAQPLLAGRHADAVVLSTLCGVSRTPLVADAIRRLADVGVPVAGVVVNGAAEASRYGYYFRPGVKRVVAVAGR